jgi:uncharacterized protein (TIGR01244 family)
MQIRTLTDQLSVSPQIGLDDLAQLASAGFRSVINNRPDGEAADQPTSAQLAEAAARHGLAYRYVPVVPGQFDAGTIGAMAHALDALPSPVLAFCRTGTRSTTVWALQACRHADAEGLLKIAREAGYDLSTLAPQLRAGRDG